METQDDGSGLQDWIKYLDISFRFHHSKSSGARFSKVPTTFRARKASRKTTTCLFGKVIFLYVVKEVIMKITATFRASRRLRFEDTKRIVSP